MRIQSKRHWLVSFWIIAILFFLLLLLSVIFAVFRKSGVTGIDAGQIQKIRLELHAQSSKEKV